MLWVAWGFPDWLRKENFSFPRQFRLRFKLAAGLGEPWCRDGGIPPGLSFEYDFHCGSLCPLVSTS